MTRVLSMLIMCALPAAAATEKGKGNEGGDGEQVTLTAVRKQLATLRTQFDQHLKADEAAQKETAVALAPLGTVVAFAGDTNKIPQGWKLCDGTPLSVKEYPDLAKILGTTYGGDGADKFGVPNYQGYFLRGLDKPDGALDPGRTLGSSQADAFKEHSHTLTKYGDPKRDGDSFASGKTFDLNGDVKTSTEGQSPTETRPKNVAVHYIIRTGPPAGARP